MAAVVMKLCTAALTSYTGAPKLLNSDLFLKKKRTTVPIKSQGVQRSTLRCREERYPCTPLCISFR